MYDSFSLLVEVCMYLSAREDLIKYTLSWKTKKVNDESDNKAEQLQIKNS